MGSGSQVTSHSTFSHSLGSNSLQVLDTLRSLWVFELLGGAPDILKPPTKDPPVERTHSLLPFTFSVFRTSLPSPSWCLSLSYKFSKTIIDRSVEAAT